MVNRRPISGNGYGLVGEGRCHRMFHQLSRVEGGRDVTGKVSDTLIFFLDILTRLKLHFTIIIAVLIDEIIDIADVLVPR